MGTHVRLESFLKDECYLLSTSIVKYHDDEELKQICSMDIEKDDEGVFVEALARYVDNWGKLLQDNDSLEKLLETYYAKEDNAKIWIISATPLGVALRAC